MRRWRELYAAWCATKNLTALPVGAVLPALRQLLDAGAAHVGPKWFDETSDGPNWSGAQVREGWGGGGGEARWRGGRTAGATYHGRLC